MYKNLILLILISFFSCSKKSNPEIDKSNKNLSTLFSSNTSYISEDTYKCIYNSEIHYFDIIYNKGKCGIFVSFSNTNNALYKGDKLINKLNYIDFYFSELYQYKILSKGTGCFQVIYLKSSCFDIDKGQKSFKKNFNILNSKTYEFSLCNHPNTDGNQGSTISIYSSENNFINKTIIDGIKQDLEIKKKKDQYYYEFYYNQDRGWAELDINFNLNNKDYITITIEVKFNYPADPLLWFHIVLYVIVGGVFCFLGYKFIEDCIKNKKNKKKPISRINTDELKVSMISRRTVSKDEQNRIKKEQLMKRSSILYDSILKNNNLLNKACLLCGKIDNEIQQNKKYYKNEDYEDEDYEDEEYENEEYDDEEYDDENYGKNYDDDIIIDNDDEIDKMKLIEDINNNKYNSFMEYITPTKCNHFYHKRCVDKYKFKYGVYSNCYFCEFFITLENMKKFGCFFTKEIFSNIFMSRFDNSINHDDTKKTMVKNIEKYFYQQIRN